VAKFESEAESKRIISGMKWMGILSPNTATIAGGNLLDTLCTQLEKLMSFKPGERDLVMLQHKFVVEWSDGKKVSAHSPYSDLQFTRYLAFPMTFLWQYYIYIAVFSPLT
jgi:hypothetical protein